MSCNCGSIIGPTCLIGAALRRWGSGCSVCLRGRCRRRSVRSGRLRSWRRRSGGTILSLWNASEHAVAPSTLPALFAAQASRTPDAVAVVYEDRRLSYAALEAHSNQLAHHLRGLGVGPETVVGLCVERSVEMVIGLLGILKAGGAYLPLDPGYPAERLSFMLAMPGRRCW